MKKTLLVLIVWSAFAAACHERKTETAPNYQGSQGASQKAHQSLDKEAGSY